MGNYDDFFHQNQNQSLNIEDNLTKVMDMGLMAAKILRPDVPELILKAMILSANLTALVELLLLADDPNTEFSLNMKQVCLGLLATADWIMPDFDMETTPIYPPEANGNVE